MKQFFVRKYDVSELSLEEFFRRLDMVSSEMDLRRVGALMGLGITYARAESPKLLGSVRAESGDHDLAVGVSTTHRSAYTYLILTIFLMYASLFLTAYLAKIGIVSLDWSLLTVVFLFSALFFIFVEDITSGISPGSRRLRQSLMAASDTVLASKGGIARSGWKSVTRFVKVKERYWSRGSGPQWTDPSEFIYAE